MLLVLVRHAHAHTGSPDAERQLSMQGEQQAQITAAAVAKQLPAPANAIRWCRPPVRARQTADFVAAGLTTNAPPKLCSFLTPEGSVGELLETLGRETGDCTVVAVTHENFVSTAAGIVQGAPAPGFRTAEARALEIEVCEPGRGQLVWRFSP